MIHFKYIIRADGDRDILIDASLDIIEKQLQYYSILYTIQYYYTINFAHL